MKGLRVLAGCFCAFAVPFFGSFASAARAQQTATEEAENRAKVLATLPKEAAKRIFGTAAAPAPMAARAIGNFARGCLAGATALPVNGETWQVMRLTRNRNWGHPALIAVIERLARQTPQAVGWRGLLVGDLSQPRGGPMLTGHASHQIGLDADIWLTEMPARRLDTTEREAMRATNLVRADWMGVEESVYTPAHLKLIRMAAQQPEITRIFVNPAIKQHLCMVAGAERAWLAKVRPMWGHNYHFHIRLACPAGDAACEDQAPPGEGDGCGSELRDWLEKQRKAMSAPPPKPPKPGDKPPAPPRIWTLGDLPEACHAVAVSK